MRGFYSPGLDVASVFGSILGLLLMEGLKYSTQYAAHSFETLGAETSKQGL